MKRYASVSPWISGVGAVLFALPAAVTACLHGHVFEVLPLALSLVYAILLGQALMWRRLGRPAVPPPARRGRPEPDQVPPY